MYKQFLENIKKNGNLTIWTYFKTFWWNKKMNIYSKDKKYLVRNIHSSFSIFEYYLVSCVAKIKFYYISLNNYKSK